ncbi:MAG TPA: hypothetical protein VNI02_24785 [Blastocatellia bacterium]|nr:hypothetical protein [Blastocatellia bacterium]
MATGNKARKGGATRKGPASSKAKKGSTGKSAKRPLAGALRPGADGAGAAAATDIEIHFGPNAKAEAVTPFSIGVLKDILRAAGLRGALITSTSRSPAEQARVMFINLQLTGVARQRSLYKPPGNKVIDVFVASKAAGKTDAQIKADMESKIIELGPTTVSRHASDPHVLCVFDVAPSSIQNQRAFVAAVRAERRVSKFLQPPVDPAFHLEIPQPQP